MRQHTKTADNLDADIPPQAKEENKHKSPKLGIMEVTAQRVIPPSWRNLLWRENPTFIAS